MINAETDNKLNPGALRVSSARKTFGGCSGVPWNWANFYTYLGFINNIYLGPATLSLQEKPPRLDQYFDDVIISSKQKETFHLGL